MKPIRRPKGLRKRCKWCKPPRMLDGLPPPKDEAEITDSICPTCKARVEREAGL
jgi:hypothetical protein